mmetsp:Transcript_73646/g.134642  ORF Transcript_73646/g.134642 Transcript_73646/m.134642 type:complete len:398 (-) Transcript_73646:59-1252(-)
MHNVMQVPNLKGALSQRLLTMKAKAQDQAQRGAELLTQVKAKANGVMNAVAAATAANPAPSLPGDEVRRYQGSSLGVRSEQMRRSASAGSRRHSSLQLLEEIRSIQAATKQSRSQSALARRTRVNDAKSDLDPTDQQPAVADQQEFDVFIDRACGTPLGIDVDFENGLQVQAVQEGNLVHAWNRHRPARAVQAGDLILEVNGMRAVDKMVAECQQTKLLRLLISRSGTSTGSSSSGQNHAVTAHDVRFAALHPEPSASSASITSAYPHPEPPAPSSVPQPTKFSTNDNDEEEEVVLFDADASSAASDHEEFKSLPTSERAGTSDPPEDLSEVCQPVCDKAASSRGSLPESNFWEWPLSRTEKKVRVELIESNLWAMEQTELLKENEMLRRRRRSSVH